MSNTQKTKIQLSVARNKLFLNLAINAIVPYLVYILLRPMLANDAAALAIAGAIPALRTIALWLWRRRVDWIGIHAVLAFVIAVVISILLGGNTLLLKIHGTLLTGVIGMVLLVSVLLRKPLLLPFFQAFSQTSPNETSILDGAESDLSSRKRIAQRISFITAVIGIALLTDMIVHVIMALTLPTAAYLGYSRVISLAVLGGGLALLWGTRRRNIYPDGS